MVTATAYLPARASALALGQDGGDGVFWGITLFSGWYRDSPPFSAETSHASTTPTHQRHTPTLMDAVNPFTIRSQPQHTAAHLILHVKHSSA